MKRHLVNKYAYASFPMGVPDHKRMPLDKHLAGAGPIQGQVRMVVHPAAFLRSSKVHMYTFSADETFHKNRISFQEELVKMLGVILGDAQKRESAAKGIFGGILPSWFSADDQRDCLKKEQEIKGAKARLAVATASGDVDKLREAVRRAREIDSFAEAHLADAESAIAHVDAVAELSGAVAEGTDASRLRSALEAASTAGVQEDACKEAKQFLERLEAKHAACKENEASDVQVLRKVFEDAKLAKYGDAACDWFQRRGLNDIAQVQSTANELYDDLGLKPLERKRLEKVLKECGGN